MILTIITINRNNAVGLRKTMQSVLTQTCDVFEYVVVDGASADGSVDVIKEYAGKFRSRLKWISEPDKGIYNAMNKGLKMATGQYVEFLNGGDQLASDRVIESVMTVLNKNSFPSILIKIYKDKDSYRDRGFAGQDISFLMFYKGTLSHPSAYIQKDLFKKYGEYDEALKIVSDWKWFLQAIVFGEEKPIYADIDVVLFDMNGISESNKLLGEQERRGVLEQLVPKSILSDYEEWFYSITQMRRLNRHPWAYKLVWLLERALFKMEKR